VLTAFDRGVRRIIWKCEKIDQGSGVNLYKDNKQQWMYLKDIHEGRGDT
jgi:hypothetical protein